MGHLGGLSLGGWSPQLQTTVHGGGPTQERLQESCRFRLRDDCPLWCAVPHASTTNRFCNSCQENQLLGRAPYNPHDATPDRLHAAGLGWSLFARHYSGSLG